jgi:uncharacterized membrane protein
VVWIAMRQGRLLARVFGYALQIVAGFAFLKDVGKGYDGSAVLNSFYLGTVFLAIAAFFCAAYIERNLERPERRLRPEESPVAYLMLVWGALWWFGGAIHEITRYVQDAYRVPALLIFAAGSSVAFSEASRWLRWPSAGWLRLAVYPAVMLALLNDFIRQPHPFAGIGAAAWAAALLAHFWLLHRNRPEKAGAVHLPIRSLDEGLHSLGVWLIAWVGARELGWLIDQAVEGKRVWPSISWALFPAIVLATVIAPRLGAWWPLRDHRRAYVLTGAAPLAVFLGLWTFYVNFTSDGDPFPLPYVPFLNPLDLAIAAAYLMVALWLRAAAPQGLQAWLDEARTHLIALAGVAGFVWINAILLRSLHYWADVPFVLSVMLSSRLVQAAFAILWMLIAMGSMVIATQRAWRALWITGAALMGAVVVKLFVVDLSNVGTVERIVSFIGAGLLMLLIGYLSPVPPKVEVKSA